MSGTFVARLWNGAPILAGLSFPNRVAEPDSPYYVISTDAGTGDAFHAVLTELAAQRVWDKHAVWGKDPNPDASERTEFLPTIVPNPDRTAVENYEALAALAEEALRRNGDPLTLVMSPKNRRVIRGYEPERARNYRVLFDVDMGRVIGTERNESLRGTPRSTQWLRVILAYHLGSGRDLASMQVLIEKNRFAASIFNMFPVFHDAQPARGRRP